MRSIEAGGLLGFLLPQVRAEVLARLLLDGREWYARELARASGLSHSAVRRELIALTEHGIALARQRGNRIYYSANNASPIHQELKMLVVKTAGVADVLRAALKPLIELIEFAYVFGSFAAGEPTDRSDVDIMVVGRARFGEVVSALSRAEAKLGREVSPSVYSLREYREKLAKGEGFIHRIHNEPKILLIGEAL